MTQLRRLDHELFLDCLSVLMMDSNREKEVHEYFERGGEIWEQMADDWGMNELKKGWTRPKSSEVFCWQRPSQCAGSSPTDTASSLRGDLYVSIPMRNNLAIRLSPSRCPLHIDIKVQMSFHNTIDSYSDLLESHRAFLSSQFNPCDPCVIRACKRTSKDYNCGRFCQ